MSIQYYTEYALISVLCETMCSGTFVSGSKVHVAVGSCNLVLICLSRALSAAGQDCRAASKARKHECGVQVPDKLQAPGSIWTVLTPCLVSFLKCKWFVSGS